VQRESHDPAVWFKRPHLQVQDSADWLGGAFSNPGSHEGAQ
jgi:hypothetical protein